MIANARSDSDFDGELEMSMRNTLGNQARSEAALVVSFVGMIALASAAPSVCAQIFDSGSNGSYGAINCTYSPNYQCIVGEGGSNPGGPQTIPAVGGYVYLDMPPDGIFHCTTITVAPNAGLRFNKNALNTPVYLLATGDITNDGVIDMSGGNASGTPPARGIGGPGGFDGGDPGLGNSVPPSDGQGPGAGLAGPGDDSDQGAGAGSFGQPPPSSYLSSKDGAAYGNPLCFPLIGGSGGGGSVGNPGYGGGGGGGALLLASNSQLRVGTIRAWGGTGPTGYNSGSGGAVRIIAPTVAASGSVFVYGNSFSGDAYSGPGRVRIDTTGPTPTVTVYPPRVASVGSFMKVFPTPMPRLDIVHAAGHDIAEGEPQPVIVQLPFGSPTTQTVTVQAKNFVGLVPIRVVATPEHGARVVMDTTIDMTNVSLGTPGEGSVDIDFPINTPTRVHAWTR